VDHVDHHVALPTRLSRQAPACDLLDLTTDRVHVGPVGYVVEGRRIGDGHQREAVDVVVGVTALEGDVALHTLHRVLTHLQGRDGTPDPVELLQVFGQRGLQGLGDRAVGGVHLTEVTHLQVTFQVVAAVGAPGLFQRARGPAVDLLPGPQLDLGDVVQHRDAPECPHNVHVLR